MWKVRPPSDDVDGQTTEANYTRWHSLLEGHTQEHPVFRQGVLVSELLGPEDGPHPDRWEERET